MAAYDDSDGGGSDDESRFKDFGKVWTAAKPHPYGLPCEGVDDEGGTKRFTATSSR